MLFRSGQSLGATQLLCLPTLVGGSICVSKKELSGKLLHSTGSSAQLCEDLEGWDGGWGGREAQEGQDMCILMAGLSCCTAKTNTTL